MALNDVVAVKGTGGLGRPAPGQDYVSGFVFYTATLPSGFTTSSRVKNFLSIADAVTAGILNTYADETKATGSYLITAPGSAGGTINISVQEFPTASNPTGLVSLGTYTVLSTDTTATILATSIAAFINSGTSTHGYTATSTTATVTITARPKLGIFLNTGSPIVVTITGTATGTITQFTGGVASLQANWYYHISEFFRLNPKGQLYVGMYPVPTTYDFTDVLSVQNFAVGNIRNWAVYCDGTTYTSAKVQAAQAVMSTMDTLHQNSSMLVTFDYSAATLSALTDLSTLNSNKVSVVIGQDGFANGYALYKGYGKSISNIGAVLGLVSKAKVSDDIAWLAPYSISNGSENDTAAFSNGVLYSSVSAPLLSTLNTQRYTFSIKQIGFSGTWVNDSHCATAFTSDYAYIENNRTIDKAIRNLRGGYLPLLNSPIVLNSDGTMSNNTVALFTGTGNTALDQMVRDAEISARSVTIDPTQNVLSTSTLVVSVLLVPVGVARNIIVNIKYTLSI